MYQPLSVWSVRPPPAPSHYDPEDLQRQRDDVQLSFDPNREDTEAGRYEKVKTLTGSLGQATVNKISTPPALLNRRDEAHGN